MTTEAKPLRKLGILTSGGDAPGMNSVIRAATLLAISKGVEVVGIEHGYRGLLEGRLRSLEPPHVARILREGGTMRGSARCPEMHVQATRDVAR
jgi:6-phosphofructokinase 1